MCIKIELEFRVLVFVEGGKPENPEKNPQSKDENQQQTQPTYGTGPESNPGHIGGRRALSPLRHPCSPDDDVHEAIHVVLLTSLPQPGDSHSACVFQCM